MAQAGGDKVYLMGQIVEDMNLKSKLAEEEVIQILEEAGVIGMTPKQIALKLNRDISAVESVINKLRKSREVIRVGRNLWILSKYYDFSKISEFTTPEQYKEEFRRIYGNVFSKCRLKIEAGENCGERIHRWFFCVQGFSAKFVNNMLTRYNIREGVVLDPYAGTGTVLVCAKMRGINSLGVELLPIFAFASKVKTDWGVDIELLKEEASRVLNLSKKWKEEDISHDIFLRETHRHFTCENLTKLLVLRKHISEVEDRKVRRLLMLALASILVPCSNLKRSPCLGYAKKSATDPFIAFKLKTDQMVEDLTYVQKYNSGAYSEIVIGDSRTVNYAPESIDIAITSPPYVNGLDYVINYKIEMAWLNLVRDYEDLSKLKEIMVACDNIPKGVIKRFSSQKPHYEDPLLDQIVGKIEEKIKKKGVYRRNDMHLIVRKYFEDIYSTFQRIYEGLKEGGRFIVVIGDSLVAGVYVPTDLMIAKMGERIGFSIERIEVARERRSGQRHDFKLRESIVILRKGVAKKKSLNLLDFL